MWQRCARARARGVVAKELLLYCVSHTQGNNCLCSTTSIHQCDPWPGLLALLCRKHGAQSVTAVEVVSELAEVASDNANRNRHADGTVCVTNCHSTEMGPLPPHERFDVMVGELLDTGLIGEGVIRSMRHAIQNLLVPGFTAVPASAQLFAQLVGGPLPAALRGLAPDLPLRAPKSCIDCAGAAAPTHMHVTRLLQERQPLVQLLSAPYEAFRFDFHQPPDGSGRKQRKQVTKVTTFNISYQSYNNYYEFPKL